MYKFYDPLGNELKKDEFINYYNNLYYNDCEYRLTRVSQNSRYVENEIENLLDKDKDGIKNNLDVIHILAWKMGKVKHKCSASKFVYHSDWEDIENWDGEDFGDLNITRYGQKFDVKELAVYLINNVDGRFKDWILINKPEYILNSFVINLKKDLNGIGTVYLVTLLYFISKGKYPIYDRFADIAMQAICDYPERRPSDGNFITANTLTMKPQNVCDNVEKEPYGFQVMKELILFKKKIDEVFDYDKNYIANRDIDRALWVYGHLFSSDKKKSLIHNKEKISNKDYDKSKLVNKRKSQK